MQDEKKPDLHHSQGVQVSEVLSGVDVDKARKEDVLTQIANSLVSDLVSRPEAFVAHLTSLLISGKKRTRTIAQRGSDGKMYEVSVTFEVKEVDEVTP